MFCTGLDTHTHTCVVYFDQLLGDLRTQNLVETLKINRKRQIRGTPSGSRPAFACRPALRSRQKHVFFRSFFVDFSREITEKALKWTKKVEKWQKKVSTSFWVIAAPKSWSKYTKHTCTHFWLWLKLASIKFLVWNQRNNYWDWSYLITTSLWLIYNYFKYACHIHLKSCQLNNFFQLPLHRG